MRQLRLIFDQGIENIEIKDGTTYEDLATRFQDRFPGQVTLALAQNCLHELSQPIGEGVEEVQLLDTRNTDGYRTYMRSLSYLFIIAARDHFPDKRIFLEHSISGASYCSIRQGDRFIPLDTRIRDSIRYKMEALVRENRQIEKMTVSLKEAQDLFKKMGRQDKADLLSYRDQDQVNLYKMGDNIDFFYGFMVPSTSYLKTFSIELFGDGMVLVGPERDKRGQVRNFVPQRKLSDAYREAEAWSELQGISQVKDLNRIIEEGNIGHVCRMAEALHQYKIMELAKEIQENAKRIILISAPSSSGKTSFANKLTTSLRVLGLRPISISMDDYYVNREDTPKKEDGTYDFESIYAIDLDLFNQDLTRLLQGQAVERIKFDFLEGKRIYTGEKIQLKAQDPVLIEGIHALNPILTKHVDQSFLFRIYLSVITQINLDDHNRIHTTDLRLMRRMARDKASRGKTVENTILEWPEVRRGEKEYIFPYQEEADAVFNSSFLFEIAMLKPILMEDLSKIGPENPAYIEASRLRSVLQYFQPVEDTSDVVNTSILREFIGGSKLVD